MRLALIICLFLLFAAPSAADGPPVLPSSFHGVTDLLHGNVIEACGDHGCYAFTTAFHWEALGVVYRIDVPGDILDTPFLEGATESELLRFSARRSGGELIGFAFEIAYWHSGTSVLLKLTFYGGNESTMTPSPTPSSLRRVIVAAPRLRPGEPLRGEIEFWLYENDQLLFYWSMSLEGLYVRD